MSDPDGDVASGFGSELPDSDVSLSDSDVSRVAGERTSDGWVVGLSAGFEVSDPPGDESVGALGDPSPVPEALVVSSVRPFGLNWNLFPPQSGHPDNISLDPSGNPRPQEVH